MIKVTPSGSYLTNEGISAGSGNSSMGATTLPVVSGTNFNPTGFTAGNSDSGGQNAPTAKAMAFEAEDGSYISVVAFTPTRNSGYGGQSAGTVLIKLPADFEAASAELMRSTSAAKQVIESVTMNNSGTAAVINLPRGEIVSVKFVKK